MSLSDPVAAARRRLDDAIASAPTAPDLLAPDDPVRAGTTLTAGQAVTLFRSQLQSREIDAAARFLRQRGTGYYTIASAGHEANAVLGAQLELTDPCLLHYRSGALMMARGQKAGVADPVLDTLLGIVAARDDPTAEGRHKVWGSRELLVQPQTSTIASHLPKAVGLAFALVRAEQIGLRSDDASPAVVCCSFGDASVNHATALAAVNAARWAKRVGSPVPVLFVCEDNRLGISVATPRRWIEESFGSLPQLRYLRAAGEMDEMWDVAEEAISVCRSKRVPVFLHLETVRLWGHAGSDAEIAYRSIDEIRADEQRDPIVGWAGRLLGLGAASRDDLARIVSEVRDEVAAAARLAEGRPPLESRAAVVAPIFTYDARATRKDARGRPRRRDRRRHFGSDLPEDRTVPAKRTMAAHINAALHDEMLRRPEMIVFGEDVGRKGGVYHVTAGLQRDFGVTRVFDTLLDETSILGLAQGTSLAGMLPVPEVQYLAYVHNALDQIRGEAASAGFFSAGQFANPFVLRVASFAHLGGFGGHFHNDNSIAALRDIPGLVVAAPSRGDDAARMLRGALATASVNGRIVCFLEPIAIYHERDLYEPGDELWLSAYPPPGDALLPGDVGLHGDPSPDILLITYANGVRMALQAAHRLIERDGVKSQVLDVRWLSPLPLEAIRDHASGCARVLVVDECRASGGVADAIVADLARSGFAGTVGSICAADSYVPLGPAAAHVLIDADAVVEAAHRLL